MLAGQRGLTLVELMVVVAVMAIVATIAYPIYTAQVQKTRRADAKIALEVIAQAQERFYTINGEYTDHLGSLQIPQAMRDGFSDRRYYTIAVSHPDGDDQRFEVTATAADPGAQADDDVCEEFTIDHLGAKTATDGGGTNCW